MIDSAGGGSAARFLFGVLLRFAIWTLNGVTDWVGQADQIPSPQRKALRTCVGQGADTLDPYFHHVARLQEFLSRHADARTGAGEDQVARLQRDHGREVRDLLGERED